MSTTLYDRPAAAERLQPRADLRRPTPLERLSLRLGLLLLTYGRRRYALTREQLATRDELERSREARELAAERSRLLLPVR